MPMMLWFAGTLRRFGRHEGGNIAIIFALMSVVLVSAAGSGIDLSRAFFAAQKLNQTALLACQYADRPSVIQTAVTTYSNYNSGNTYRNLVTTRIASILQDQKFEWTQLTATPFSFTPGGSAQITLSTSVPTTFMQIVGINAVPVTTSARCYDSPGTINPVVPNGGSPFLFTEGFEAVTCVGTCVQYIPPSGSGPLISTPVQSFPASPNYTGTTGTQWRTMGYCTEIDTVGLIESTTPDGTHSLELDCDDGSGDSGNSSISTQIYLAAGTYEMRYFYASRVRYPDYEPVMLCGSAASDLSWANSTNSTGGPEANALRTNQVNVYLDLDTSGSPPLHTTILEGQRLAGGNLIDMCLHAPDWVERSVDVTISTAGFYWLSFAADGTNDSFGGQIDGVKLCYNSCPATLQDNFPPSWTAANNGGAYKQLFQDTLDDPDYNGSTRNTNGDMNDSTGTSGTSSSGWPSASASGWGVAPYNQMDYMLTASAQGTQSIELDGTNASGAGTSRRLTSRPFLLQQGYYRLEYSYVSQATFTTLSGIRCGATPSAAVISGLTGTGTAAIRTGGSTNNVARDTNIVGVFMSHFGLVSFPLGAALNAQTSYYNPNGTTSTTPTAAPDAVSLTSYNASQNNPLLDICGYAASWQSRTAYIKIQKPAYYSLTFAALGTTDAIGGVVDNIRLTSLNSLYGTVPAGAVTIPVPTPAPGSTISYTGFSFPADQLTP